MCLRFCCCPYLGYYPGPHAQRRSTARKETTKSVSTQDSLTQHSDPGYTDKPKRNPTSEEVSRRKAVPKPSTIGSSSSSPKSNPRTKSEQTGRGHHDTTVPKISSSQGRNPSRTHKNARKSSAEGVSLGKPTPNPRRTRTHRNTGKRSTAERFTSGKTELKISANTDSSSPLQVNPMRCTCAQETLKQNAATVLVSGDGISINPAHIQENPPRARQTLPSTAVGASPLQQAIPKLPDVHGHHSEQINGFHLQQAYRVTTEEFNPGNTIHKASAAAGDPPSQRNNPNYTDKYTNAAEGSAEGSAESFYEQLTGFIGSMNLDKFYSQHDSYLHELCEKAADLVKDETAILNKPKDVFDMTKVALYDTIVYCDDSASMQTDDGRIKALKELVRRVTKITTILDPGGIKVRFINFAEDGQFNDIRTQNAVEEIVSPIMFNGWHTKIGTKLKEKILEPLLFEKARAKSLKKPLLITTITDGEPTGEDKEHFRDTVHSCLDTLEEHGYNPKSAIFQVSQVGNSSQATAFIRGLQDDKKIGHMIYCTSGSVDQKMAELKDNERNLERWLLDLLLQGLDGPLKV